MNPSFLVPGVGNAVPELGATTSISSATNVFLTPSSLGLQSVTMTTVGQSVFLPPAYSIVPGATKFSVKNNGIYPFGVRDSFGNLLTGISGGGYATFSLDNSSNWVFTGNNLEPGLITITNTFSSTISSTTIPPFVVLDNNTSIHFLSLTSGFAAVVVDNIGKIVSTPVTVSATASSAARTCFKIDTTRAIVFFGSGNTDHQAVVLSLTGISPALSLSVGTPASLTATLLGGSWNGEDFLHSPKIAQLTPTLYSSALQLSTQANGITAAISVTGTTVTIGATANFGAATLGQVIIFAVTATTALVFYKVGTNSSGVIVSISGTTSTVNTPVSTGVTSSTGNLAGMILVSPTKAIYGDDGAASSVILAACTITGTTLAFGTPFTLDGAAGGTAVLAYDSITTRYAAQMWIVSTGATNLIGVWWRGGGSKMAIVSETAGTITAGNRMFNSISSTGTAANQGYGALMPQGLTDLIAIRQDSSGTPSTYRFNVLPHKVNGQTISTGSTGYVDALTGGPSVADGLTMIRLGSSDYVVTFNGAAMSGVIPVFRTDGDNVAFRGNIRTPQLLLANNIGAFTGGFNNRLVLIGNATYQGNFNSSNSSATRLLNVEIAQ